MGSHLDKPVTEKDSDNDTLEGGLLYSGSAMQGWRVNMEDSHCAKGLVIGGEKASLVCVFDGHGGDLVAIEAAKRVQPTMQTALSGCSDTSNPKEIGEKMQEGFMTLDEDLKKMAPVQSGEDQSGCTAIVAIITKTHIIVANAGDARGILMQGDAVKPMSFDHKPTNEGETKRIEAAGGCVSMRRVNGDLAVSRALGDFTYKQTDSMPAKDQMVSAFPDIEIAERDGSEQFLLLCCDGIWDVMSNDEAGAFIQQLIIRKYAGEPLSKANERLLDKCLEKGSRDNMSAVLVVNPSAITPGEGVKPPEVVFQEQQAAMEADGSDTKTQRV